MSEKLVYLCSFVLVLGLVLPSVAHAVHPTPVAWWKLDGDVLDSSGNERNGTLHGNPQWVPGVYGDALEFDGDDYVTIDGYKGIVTDGTNTSAFTITAWFKAISDGELIGWGSSGDGNRAEFRVDGGRLRYESGGGNVQGATNVTDNKWHHGAVTIPRNAVYVDVTIYLDGKDDTQPEDDTDVVHPLSDYDAIMGQRYNQSNSRWYTGAIDDLRIYDVVLTLEEIHEAMAGIGPVSPSASQPGPEDKSTDVPRDVVLSWTPGEYAPPVNGHKLYFSENFDDVNDGIGGIIQDANSYTPPQLLDFGKTYYWRVDEVSAPPDSTIFEGNVWQFTVEPFAYPIAGDNITATASSVQQANMDPENTVNGSGLDADDLHSTGEMNMWLSSTTGPQPTWIEYEFDSVYKLHEMWVWNSNQSLEQVVGLGVKDVYIGYSTDGTDYAALGTTHEFAQAPGTDGYAHNTTVDFGGVAAKYVRLTANSNWGGFLPQYGLSEVRFFYIPVRAREPSPDSGATDVDVDVTLSFRAGREAAQHDVYLTTDEQAVIDGNAPVTTVTEASYGPLPLDLGQTYYWKVNEVNTAETPTMLEGSLWNFATHEFLVVDDFESYNDLDPDDPDSNRIFNTWIDGYEQPANGSLVGYENAPFCEQTIVHSGAQSMPLFYDNSGTARYSEAELTLSPAQDWTEHAVNALSLWFSGDPNNAAEQMYVKVNGSKVTYDSDADNLARKPWQPWNIDLAWFGIDLQNVTKLSIGFGDETSMTPGGSGMVFFDDIRLYPYSRQLSTPAEPNAAGLVAHYEFEGNTSDSSGNGLHGTAMGSPAFVASKVGQAISLDGFNDYVEITGYKGILGPNAFSVSAWVQTTYMGDDPQEIVYYGTHGDGQRCEFRIHTDGHIRMGNGAGQVVGLTAVTDGAWHHVAATIIENATNSSSDVRIYVDGQDDTQESADPDAFNLVADWDVTIGYRPSQNDRFFLGLLDDVRIYDRALTAEEIAWLAGRSKPFDKPF